MIEQMRLFDTDDSYSLINLKESCKVYIKKKYPNPIEDESWEEYLKMLSDETDLEFVARLRKIADDIEKRVLEPVKEEVRFMNDRK